MLDEIKDILTRSHATMVEDLLGVGTLFVLLFVGLSWVGAA
jgi:hypothetical protein